MDRSLLQYKHSIYNLCSGWDKAKCHHSGPPPMKTIVKMFIITIQRRRRRIVSRSTLKDLKTIVTIFIKSPPLSFGHHHHHDHHQVNAGRPRQEYRHGGNPSSQVPETMHCKSLRKQSRRTYKWTKMSPQIMSICLFK